MKNLRALLVFCALAASVVACGDSSAVVAPEAPRLDGGYTFGGGNRGNDTTSTAPAPVDDGAATTQGGYTFGGGN